MGYYVWAGMNEANRIYHDHDADCPCYKKILAEHPTARKRRD